MSVDIIPPSNGHLNTYGAGFAHYMAYMANLGPRVTLQELALVPAPEPVTPPKKPKRRLGPRKSTSRVRKYTVKRSLEASLTLPQIQEHGFTHPANGRYVMLPREFDVVLALETKAVSQVVLAVLRRTIGYPGDGPINRAIWAEISTYDLASTGYMSHSAAQRGLKEGLKKGYILRREIVEEDAHERKQLVRYEYAVKWKGMQN
jgi:hypothetical protein